MIRIALIASVGALMTACSMTPTVTKERTTMTVGEIKEAGLECRKNIPIDSNIPRTICASPESWLAYEARARSATDELLAEGRKLPNVGGYNRN